MDYKKAGVDIEAGYKSVELMKKHVKETMRPEVLGGLGGFAGAFDLSAIKDMEEPVLLSGTDGCGTKVKLAFVMDKHDTIGIDAVAMCVNDIACSGGEPLFFLDYIACGKNYPEKIATIVSGVAEGCKQSGCALVGGETAEHPGLMPENDYDLAGFAVGVVDKKDIINGENIKPGEDLVGIASIGVHSNGFSLVRKVFEMNKETLDTYYDELGKTLGEALIEPTRIYVKALKNVKDAGVKIKGCSHITGGGFDENIPRMLPEGIKAIVKKDSYKVPAIFELIVSGGGTDLQSVIDAVENNSINGQIVLVISNRKNAYGLERAKKAGIETAVVRKDDELIVKMLKERDVDLVVLAGYLAILTDVLIDAYPNKIINIHPSLIPAFCGPGHYGMHVHEKVLARGVKVTGATVHFVSKEVDGGPIILQETCNIDDLDNAEDIQKRVLEIEHRILPKAVALYCDGKIIVENERAKVI